MYASKVVSNYDFDPIKGRTKEDGTGTNLNIVSSVRTAEEINIVANQPKEAIVLKSVAEPTTVEKDDILV